MGWVVVFVTIGVNGSDLYARHTSRWFLESTRRVKQRMRRVERSGFNVPLADSGCLHLSPTPPHRHPC